MKQVLVMKKRKGQSEQDFKVEQCIEICKIRGFKLWDGDGKNGERLYSITDKDDMAQPTFGVSFEKMYKSVKIIENK